MDQEVSQQVDVAEIVVDDESYETSGAQALADLNAFIAEHGDEIVESPRLPGVPLPLRALINACPEPITEENAHKFLAEAQALLEAARAKKMDGAEEEIESAEVEEEPAKKKLK